MRQSVVEDIDGDQYPDPLTINYQRAIDKTTGYPDGFKLTRVDLKKLWVKLYKETGQTELDDVLLSVNGIEHQGVLEPEDVIYNYNIDAVRQFEFVDLTENETN